MSGINIATVQGRLTRDPEIRYFESGSKKASFSVAVDRYNGKDREKTTDYIDCAIWGDRAEFVGEHFRKGKAITVIGSLKYESWEDESGKKASRLILLANQVDFPLTEKSSESGTTGGAKKSGGNKSTDEGGDGIPF